MGLYERCVGFVGVLGDIELWGSLVGLFFVGSYGDGVIVFRRRFLWFIVGCLFLVGVVGLDAFFIVLFYVGIRF